MNYYNEHDPKATAWLRELIAKGLIANGIVDERSITEIKADELAGYCQCHFFAGIGGWSYALRLAGWPDERPVWTGSCPCQPFSSAGKGKGNADERHLWPSWFNLIRECNPCTIFGEQVERAIKFGWLDGVSTDLEGENYAFGSAVLGAHSVGAPHLRQRLYWMAHHNTGGFGKLKEQHGQPKINSADRDSRRTHADGYGESCCMANAGRTGNECGLRSEKTLGTNGAVKGEAQQREWSGVDTRSGGEFCGVAKCSVEGLERPARECLFGNSDGLASNGSDEHWRNFDVLPFKDGKYRRVEAGTFPLAHGIPHRVGLLRGYGNAIVPQVAAQFIKAAFG